MKILHLSTYDVTGGAARATYRLHTGLRRLGHDSLMLVAHKRSGDPVVKVFVPPVGPLPSRWRRRQRRRQIKRSFARYRTCRPAGYELFSDDRTEHGAALLDQLPPCDVIHVHWIAGFVDYQAFFCGLPKHIPIVWTLHDMNAFTGGCHYDHGCGRYRDRCGACPQLGSSDAQDLSYRTWRRKQEIFGHVQSDRLHIVTPSRWLAQEVKRSTILSERFPVSVIPNGVDLEVLSPRGRDAARDVLGIPRDADVILFTAASMSNRRKGFALLAESLSGLGDTSNLFLVSLGDGKPAVSAQIPHLHLGFAGSERLLSVVYSAADVFVIPSLQDNLPNSVLEAMACGVPVVGFAVGGIPEMVRPDITGLLALPEDVTALRAALLQMFADPIGRQKMAAECKRMATREYTLEVQAHRYAELYSRMVSASQTKASGEDT